MSIDHRRPLIAFVAVALLCTFVTVNGYLLVARSSVGSDLAGARGLFSGFEGPGQPQLMPGAVGGATVLGEPGVEAPVGTTTQVLAPAILAAPEVDAASSSAAATGAAVATTPSPGGVDAVVTSPGQAATPGRSQGDRDARPGDGGGDPGGNGQGRPPSVGPGPDNPPADPDGGQASELTLARLIELAEHVELVELVEHYEQPRLIELAQLIEDQVDLDEEDVVLEDLVELVEPNQLTLLDELATHVDQPETDEATDDATDDAGQPESEQPQPVDEPDEAEPTPTEPVEETGQQERLGVTGRTHDAERPEPVEAPEPVEPSVPAEAPEPVEPPAPVEAPQPVEAPEPVVTPEPVEPPAPVEAPEPVEPPAPVEAPEPVELPESPSPSQGRADGAVDAGTATGEQPA